MKGAALQRLLVVSLTFLLSGIFTFSFCSPALSSSTSCGASAPLLSSPTSSSSCSSGTRDWGRGTSAEEMRGVLLCCCSASSSSWSEEEEEMTKEGCRGGWAGGARRMAGGGGRGEEEEDEGGRVTWGGAEWVRERRWGDSCLLTGEGRCRLPISSTWCEAEGGEEW